MPLVYPEIKTFPGLYLQANSFSVPDGAMERAHNVDISKDNVATKCRGFYQYYDPSSDSLNQIAVFQSKLIGIFSTLAGYFTDAGVSPNFTGTRTSLSGAAVSITALRIARTVESNKNFYFTSDQGLLKMETYSSAVYSSGVPQALDLRARFLKVNGPITGNKMVGWRTVFGRKDGNGNVLIGAPSDIMTLTNTNVTAAAWSRTTNIVTVTSTAHGLATGMIITVSESTSSDLVVAGTYTVTVTGVDAFTIASIDSDTTGTLTYEVAKATRLEYSIPSEISSTADGWFVRIYRSSQVASSSDAIFSDFKLIDQKTLTSAELTAHVGFYDDDIAEILLGDELYTNENSQEGEAAANFRPPLAEDVCLFKGYVVYGNIDMRHLLDLQVVEASVMANADYLQSMVVIATAATYTSTGAGPYTVTVTSQAHGLTTGQSIFVDNATDADADGTFIVTVLTSSTFTYSTSSGNPLTGSLQFGLVRRYVARTGVGNSTVLAAAAAAVGKVEFTYVDHGLANGDTVYVSNIVGSGISEGTYFVVNKAANTIQIALTSGGTAISHTAETAVDFEGVTNGTYPIFKLDISSSASVQLRDTARGLVRAINRDQSSLIYASYSSGISQIPGKIKIQAKGFTGAIYFMGNDATTGSAFSPVMPAAFDTGAQVFSSGADLPNVTAFAKNGEPEAVPLGSRLPHGAANKTVLRIAPLQDSLIVIKEDGVYRMTGDDPSNFSTRLVDATVICVAPDSLAILNGEAFFLSNQGVCRVSDTTIQIISRKIEDVIQPIVGSSVIAAQTSGTAYESERVYLLSTIEPGETVKSITWVYNILNDSWTSREFLHKRAVVGPSDTLYLVNEDGILNKERKNQNRLDYSGQNYTANVDSVAADLLTALITFGAGADPVRGDVITKDGIFTRIADTALISGSQYSVTFEKETNLEAADVETHYEKYVSEFKFAPFHGGAVGRMKFFAEFQMHFRNDSFGAGSIYFAGDTFGSSEETVWETLLVPYGWGDGPWGIHPYGSEDTIELIRQTGPAPICRVPVPRYQCRGTFIQALVTNERAGDPINLQAVTWVVRPYNERVTR